MCTGRLYGQTGHQSSNKIPDPSSSRGWQSKTRLWDEGGNGKNMQLRESFGVPSAPAFLSYTKDFRFARFHDLGSGPPKGQLIWPIGLEIIRRAGMRRQARRVSFVVCGPRVCPLELFFPVWSNIGGGQRKGQKGAVEAPLSCLIFRASCENTTRLRLLASQTLTQRAGSATQNTLYWGCSAVALRLDVHAAQVNPPTATGLWPLRWPP